MKTLFKLLFATATLAIAPLHLSAQLLAKNAISLELAKKIAARWRTLAPIG